MLGPPPVPWPLAAPGAVDPKKTPPDTPNFPKKCHFRSLLNDELSICCTNVTNVEDVLLVERALVQRVLVRFPRMFENLKQHHDSK